MDPNKELFEKDLRYIKAYREGLHGARSLGERRLGPGDAEGGRAVQEGVDAASRSGENCRNIHESEVVNPLKYRRGLIPALLCLSFAFSGTLLAQAGAVPAPRVLVEGEDLIYNVRYTFIDLGQVRIRNYGGEKKVSFNAYDTRANIDSYKSIPFVDLHAIFLSTIDSAVYSRAFTGKVKQDESWDFARYHFEYDRDRVLIEKGNRDTVVSQWDTLNVKGNQQDGLSLFFFARDHLYAGRTIHAPAIVAEKPVNAYINFLNERDEVEIDAIDYPVDVVYFDGNAGLHRHFRTDRRF